MIGSFFWSCSIHILPLLPALPVDVDLFYGLRDYSSLPVFLLQRLPFTSNRMRVRVRVPKRDRYAVMLLNSDGLDLRLKGSVTFTNPDGEQLSVEQIPLPNTLFALMILYLLT